MRTKVAVIQTSYSRDMQANIDKTIGFIEEAASRGGQIILPPELFQNIYFCATQEESWFEHAYPATEHPCVTQIQPLAKKLGVVVPVSIFERDGPHTYNSVVIVDDAGDIMGIYRKSHLPDGPGYQEKYYFRPGQTGFKVWKTRFGCIGVGICWDQWFPEAARMMMLQGAELLLYPSAIGSEPQDDKLDTSKMWQRVMQGHAVSNIVPVIAANRIGREEGLGAPQTFYGQSFIADHTGEIVSALGDSEEGIIVHEFDLAYHKKMRSAWGFFRDRRSDLYDL